MAGSANALQAAIFSRLTGDATLTGMIGAGAVFDRRLTGKTMPYVVLSEIATNDFGPDAEEHLVTIEAWSDAEGRKQAQEIAARVKTLLDGAALSLTGFSLVNLTHRSTRARREPKTRAHVAQMVFRAVTEE
jgi:nucleoid DNA-binding protein